MLLFSNKSFANIYGIDCSNKKGTTKWVYSFKRKAIVLYEQDSKKTKVKFEIKNPDSWIKRNYIRNYLQGSKELRGALIDFDWKAIWQASKSGEKIPLKSFISVLDFKRALNGLKKHPEGFIVTITFAVNTTSDSLRDAFWIMKSTFRGIKLFAIGKKKILNRDK